MGIAYRLLWAAFLSVMVGWAFRRSWKIEHGKTERLIGDTNESVVWISPLIFPIMIGVFSVSTVSADGVSGGIGLLLNVFMIISIYIVLLLFLLPLLRKRYSAKTCATLWLVPTLLFFQPHMLENSVYSPLYTIYIPEKILFIAVGIWLGVSILIFLFEIFSALLFRHKLLKPAKAVRDKSILDLWDQEKVDMGYRYPVQLLISGEITTPLSMGLLRKTKVTLLPECFYSQEQLRLIFRHELRHIQRRDVDTKIFLSFCRAIGWFNPLVWIALRKAADDLELSCDEIVLENADQDQRRRYAELLLHTAGTSRGFTTCLSAAAQSLKYRLSEVVRPRVKKRGTLILAMAMFVSCLSYGSFAISCERGDVGSMVLTGVTPADVLELSYYDEESEETVAMATCSEELLDYLKNIKAEKLLNGNSYYAANQINEEFGLYCEGTTENGKFEVSFYGRYMWVDGKGYYLISPKIDEAYVKSFFEK